MVRGADIPAFHLAVFSFEVLYSVTFTHRCEELDFLIFPRPISTHDPV